MGRCPKYDFNMMKKGDYLRIPGDATRVYVLLNYWKQRYGMVFDVQTREGNTLLRDERGNRYAIVTVVEPFHTPNVKVETER